MKTVGIHIAFAIGVVLCSVPAQAIETLIQKTGTNSYKPGLASAWSETASGTVVFTLNQGVDALSVADALRERLRAEVAVVDGKLHIRGIPKAVLFEQLAILSVREPGDPLATLADLGTASTSPANVEAGGSIRAAQPLAPLDPAVVYDENHDPKERFIAEVLEVRRRPYPTVELKLRVRKAPTAGPGKSNRLFRYGATLETPVVIWRSGTVLDLNQTINQRNIGAYYLQAGDRVVAHATVNQGRIEIDWIEREPK